MPAFRLCNLNTACSGKRAHAVYAAFEDHGQWTFVNLSHYPRAKLVACEACMNEIERRIAKKVEVK